MDGSVVEIISGEAVESWWGNRSFAPEVALLRLEPRCVRLSGPHRLHWKDSVPRQFLSLTLVVRAACNTYHFGMMNGVFFR